MSAQPEPLNHAVLLAEAEALLQQRQCGQSLQMFESAGAAGADEDRCAAGAWMAHMLLGQYEQAWVESDGIRARGNPDPHRFWQGEPLAGKRVMLRCLHGYGDTVMYLRWLPLLRAIAAEVTVQAAPELLPLLRCFAGIGRVLTWNAAGETDGALWEVQIECAELPYLFRATPATLPPPTHLSLPATLSHRARLRLGQRTLPRVGLVWSGSDFDAARSIPLEQLQHTLLQNHAVEWWSLQPPTSNAGWLAVCAQRGWSARTFYTMDEEVRSGTATEPVAATTLPAADPAPLPATIEALAAFAAEFDLIVTIDTLAAHLAGSLGVPTWLLLKYDADWRWIVDRNSTPWYPCMELFRQGSPGDWAGVLGQVCNRLRDWAEEAAL